MDQSPPKRVTRARAAAKTDTGVKTTKIATAASKAKVTRTAPTKRKTRADDTHEDDQDELNEPIIEPELPKPTRGRAKKAAVVEEPEMEEEAPVPAKATRGRQAAQKEEIPTKSTRGRKVDEQAAEAPAPTKSLRARQVEALVEEPVEEAPAPVKSTRGRPRKAVIEPPAAKPARSLRGRPKEAEVEEEPIVVDEPVKKATRGRAATISKATAPKKTVKFEEPDKENIVPPPANAKGKAKDIEASTGLKAKPVRKPATRTIRGRAKVEEKKQKSSPLSPKKATQVASAKNLSEDELATNEKTPMKPLMRSPMKPPGSIFSTAKKLDFSTSNSITVNRATVTDLGGSIMASPARRPPQSPFKDSLKTSPQKQTFGDSLLRSPFKMSLPAPKTADSSSPFKASLLQSPARRPQSPTKVTETGSPTRTSTFAVTPKTNTFKISRFATPKTLTKGVMRPQSTSNSAVTGIPSQSNDTPESDMMSAQPLKFTGRLSSIMPREADPALSSTEPIVEEAEDQTMAETENVNDSEAIDTIVVQDAMETETTTPPASPSRNTGAFTPREQNENPFVDSDSEDELASGSPMYSPLPLGRFKISTRDFASPKTPFTSISKTPRTSATQRVVRNQQIGFTPLARQLSDWMSASPEKSEHSGSEEQTSISEGAASVQPSPTKSTYFDDEMSIRDEMQAAPEIPDEVEEIGFAPVALDEEDLALAQEADEMSLLETDNLERSEMFEPPQAEAEIVEDAFEELIDIEPEQFKAPEQVFEEPVISHPEVEEQAFEKSLISQPQLDEEQTFETPVPSHPLQAKEEILEQPIDEPLDTEMTPSEASQEYGDENAMPLDPALFAPAPSTPIYSTPRRVFSERVCHTVSKVPLKAAAEDSPMRPSPMKRSASISRLPVQRPSSNLTRSNTVISYSPSKRVHRSKSPSKDVEMQDAATPTKLDIEVWSTIATPARTPRRDLNTALLKGAIVFVDVHTTEGADASMLFTELLTQMGARAVKSWNWNGNNEDGKVGITHVVFKDGSKRTLEKARQTGGVVSCVGVGWVLE